MLRKHVSDESVDLIYLDPPFNSNASYNVLFAEKSGEKSAAQITAFEDTWHWSIESEKAFHETVTEGPQKVADLLQSLRAFLGQNDMMAYLTMMAPRLVKLHRVLKSTGSIYLHCDPTASHYLKIMLDAVFGPQQFRNEIIWKRTSAHSGASRYGPVHDSILFYSKTDEYIWNEQYGPYDEEYVNAFFTHTDEQGRRWRRTDLTGPGIRKGDSGLPWRGFDPTAGGRHWQPPSYFYDKYKSLTGDDLAKYELIRRLDKLDSIGLIHWPKKDGGVPQGKRLLEDAKGIPMQDVWIDLKPIHNISAERLGYPTQKPEALLDRIINASSNPGDIVLDPFCGCGTAIAVAEHLHRNWIGIDVTHIAIALMRHRLNSAFRSELSPYVVIGGPKDVASAEALAQESRYQFEVWAVSLVDAMPGQDKKKGADSGIDGYINFFDDNSGKAKKIIVQVKSGHVSVSQIRDLKGVLDRAIQFS